ncbi:hypothetical protein D3C85_98630 [compost metagenome]
MANNVVAEATISDSTAIWIEYNPSYRRPFTLDCGFNRRGRAVVELPRSYKTLAAAKAGATRLLGARPNWNC